MSTQLLIYKSAVPVNRTTHHDCFVDVHANYTYAAAVNSVPLMAVEFPLAATEYPIVFGGTETDLTPVAILGVRADENLFLGDDGSWRAKYIPAFVRRYPFVFSHSDEKFVLCVDEEFAGFNREGRGERLFNEDGTTTPYVDGILKFLQDYQVQFQTTQRVCHRIRDLGLLDQMTAQVNVESGPPLSLGGFMAVSREKLKALPAETLAELAKSDELELIYMHLHSLRNFDNLRDLLGQHPPADRPTLN
jgi:SapC protein